MFALAFCVVAWRWISPFCLRRNVDLSEGPLPPSFWEVLIYGPGHDKPEVTEDGQIRYKGVIYARVATGDDSGDENV